MTPSPYELGSFPIAFFCNPDTGEYNQIMLNLEQTKEFSRVLAEILMNAPDKPEGFDIMTDDVVVVTHKLGHPIKEYYTEQELLDAQDEQV
jgi:hypothetical protein